MNRGIKVAVERAFSAVGYRIVPEWRFKKIPPTKEEILCEILERFEISTVIDVGGNEGQFRDFLRNEVCYSCNILTFEPLKAMFDTLQNRARGDALWRVFGFALGAQEETLPLNVASSSDFSSFLSQSENGKINFEIQSSVDHVEMVDVRRLDNVLHEICFDPADTRSLLKVDTQGFDMEVLKGTGEGLRDIAAMQIEMSAVPIYENMPSYIDAFTFLAERGFIPAGFFPVSTRSDRALIEFDCIMVNPHCEAH